MFIFIYYVGDVGEFITHQYRFSYIQKTRTPYTAIAPLSPLPLAGGVGVGSQRYAKSNAPKQHQRRNSIKFGNFRLGESICLRQIPTLSRRLNTAVFLWKTARAVFPFILPQANYHSAKPIIILAKRDYHSAKPTFFPGISSTKHSP